MRKIWIAFLLIILCVHPACALELKAPTVPSSAAEQMPEKPETFAEGLSQLFWKALSKIRPDLVESSRIAVGAVGTVMLVSLIRLFPGSTSKVCTLSGAITLTMLFLSTSQSMASLAVTVIQELTEYSRLLLPVMTTALAAQGGITASTALYAGTAAFTSLLSSVLSRFAAPIVFLYIAVSAVHAAVGEDMLKKLREYMKKLSEWFLKTILGFFSSYVGIIGFVSNSTDAAAVKAAKTAISTAVPVVGGTLANASESILSGAAIVKNTVGIYGIYGILAIFLAPFMRIGCHYLILKLTLLISSFFDCKELTELIEDFSSAMGMLLAMVAALCLMQLISLACFLKGGSG